MSGKGWGVEGFLGRWTGGEGRWGDWAASGLTKSPGRRVRRHVRPNHLRRVDDPIEFRLADVAEFQRRSLQRKIIVQRIMRDLRGLIVSDHWGERGDDHQRTIDVLLDFLAIGLCPLDQ